ncbi:hypothetical protein EVAR_66427_1 [Eumeta japonica]|uniref:Uncharacterized protein n=1 Tax=Eumeta variegata TaxID=151549 RepID=A0A4C1ZIV2_EUMVA|nr:hypothetical protein EVAR_66427_1 [Eumeta japonica]
MNTNDRAHITIAIIAAHKHSQPETSHLYVASLLDTNLLEEEWTDRGWIGMMEEEWTTGILNHWTKCKRRNCYFMFVFCVNYMINKRRGRQREREREAMARSGLRRTALVKIYERAGPGGRRR